MTIKDSDKRIFLFIKEHIENNGVSPTLTEIKEHFNYKSLTSVQRAIIKLEDNNLLIRDKYQQRGINITKESKTTVNIPIVGNVACGSPLLAIENIEGYIPTDKKFISGDEKGYFYLRAVGDSMNEAHINDGDLILVKLQQTADDGQKVVALINDEATVKFLKKGSDYIALMPKSSNSLHKPIILQSGDPLIIQGVVVNVFGL
ncbi:MAG: transcriptional repressor LexA [Candidatus Shapirobacteria bacterium]|jgi:repressor LexA